MSDRARDLVRRHIVFLENQYGLAFQDEDARDKAFNDLVTDAQDALDEEWNEALVVSVEATWRESMALGLSIERRRGYSHVIEALKRTGKEPT